MLWFQGLEAPTQQVQHNRKHRFTYNPRHASYICNCDSKPSCWYTKQWCVNKACIVHNVHVDLHPLCLYHTETYPCTYCTQKAATWQASGVILGGHILMRIPVHTCGKTQGNVVITWPRSIPYSRKTHSHMFVISQPTYYLLLLTAPVHAVWMFVLDLFMSSDWCFQMYSRIFQYITRAMIRVGSSQVVPRGNPPPSVCCCQTVSHTDGEHKFDDVIYTGIS